MIPSWIIKLWIFRPCLNDMDLSKNRGEPQNGWFIMENPIKMDDWKGTTIFKGCSLSTALCFCFGTPPSMQYGGRLLLIQLPRSTKTWSTVIIAQPLLSTLTLVLNCESTLTLEQYDSAYTRFMVTQTIRGTNQLSWSVGIYHYLQRAHILRLGFLNHQQYC